MTVTVSQTGFTDYAGTVANLVDGSDVTYWQFGAYSDNTGNKIIFDMGGWFDSSMLGGLQLFKGGFVGLPVGSFAIQLSADSTNWYNMPDSTATFDFGRSTMSGGVATTTAFNPFGPSGSPFFRYIRLKGVGGATVNDPSSGHGQTFNEMEWRGVGDVALTIDTSGGANPIPPTAPPDDDGGGSPTPPPPPDPPVDSGATAKVVGVDLGVLRVDFSSARVAGVSLGVLRADPSTVKVAGVSLGVLMLVTHRKVRAGRATIIG